MFKLDLQQAGEPSIKLPTSARIIEKAKKFQKNIYFCFTDYTKAFDCVDYNKLWNILKAGNIRPPYLPPDKSACRSRSNSNTQT